MSWGKVTTILRSLSLSLSLKRMFPLFVEMHLLPYKIKFWGFEGGKWKIRRQVPSCGNSRGTHRSCRNVGFSLAAWKKKKKRFFLLPSLMCISEHTHTQESLLSRPFPARLEQSTEKKAYMLLSRHPAVVVCSVSSWN